jgi:hypothetical protein
MRKGMRWIRMGFLFAAAFLIPGSRVFARNEILTVPLVLADYYAWTYAEAFEDKAEVYGWSTAGVDALGWTLVVSSGDDAGLVLVNAAGLAKTLYPVATLLGASDPAVRERAWIAVGTHSATLLALGLLGRPAVSVRTGMGPRRDGSGVELALRF